MTIQETGRLAAPLLGAGLFVLIGGGAVAAIDGATFVFAALVITRLRAADQAPVAAAAQSGSALLAGVRHIWSTPGVRIVVCAATAVMALSGTSSAAAAAIGIWLAGRSRA